MTSAAASGAVGHFLYAFEGIFYVRKALLFMHRFFNIEVRNSHAMTYFIIFHVDSSPFLVFYSIAHPAKSVNIQNDFLTGWMDLFYLHKEYCRPSKKQPAAFFGNTEVLLLAFRLYGFKFFHQFFFRCFCQ